MALFRVFLYFSKHIHFFKLMGCGKNGTFDIYPDLNQWALLFTAEEKHTKAPAFFYAYWNFFRCDVKEFLLQPIEGHGLWDKKKVFGEPPLQADPNGSIAVLTRATIKMNRLKNFWNNVDSVASKMAAAKGLIVSYGIGEIPWIKQATFSVWENKSAMKDFAYNTQEHIHVIQKTRSEGWYKEEMFVRFRILETKGFPAHIEAMLTSGL
jgi:hypothetical protein